MNELVLEMRALQEKHEKLLSLIKQIDIAGHNWALKSYYHGRANLTDLDESYEIQANAAKEFENLIRLSEKLK